MVETHGFMEWPMATTLQRDNRWLEIGAPGWIGMGCEIMCTGTQVAAAQWSQEIREGRLIW